MTHPTPSETPIPRRVAAIERKLSKERHECLYEDGPVLMDYVRQHRRRTWWITTSVALALALSLGSIAFWLYQTGQAVGTAQRDLMYLQRAEEVDRTNINKTQDQIFTLDRVAVQRHNAVEQALIKIDAKLERIEDSLKKRR